MKTIGSIILPFEIPKDKLEDFSQRWKVTELALFGSVLRADFGPDSDIDVMVTFSPEAHWSLLDLVRMQQELEDIFCRPVDLVEREAIIRSPNYIRRKNIMQSAQVIYAT